MLSILCLYASNAHTHTILSTMMKKRREVKKEKKKLFSMEGNIKGRKNYGRRVGFSGRPRLRRDQMIRLCLFIESDACNEFHDPFPSLLMLHHIVLLLFGRSVVGCLINSSTQRKANEEEVVEKENKGIRERQEREGS